MTRGSWIWLLFWFILSAIWSGTAATKLGPTYDEPFYLESGLQSWHRFHRQKDLIHAGTMPLPAKVDSLPLFLAERITGHRIDLQTDLDRWLPVARHASLLFWFLLLWAVLKATIVWGDNLAGRIAVALVATEPVLLGHSCLATTDLAFTATLMMFIASYCARLGKSQFHRIYIPAFWLGMTLLSKVSAIVFVPLCVVVLEFDRAIREKAQRKMMFSRQAIQDKILILLGGITWMLLLCPWALQAIQFQFIHNARGHGGYTFLLGEVRDGSFRYYFIAAFFIKSSTTLLGGLFLTCRSTLIRFPTPFFIGLSLLLLSVTFRVQIGVRFSFPVLVFFLISVSLMISFLYQSHMNSRAWRYGLLTLLYLGIGANAIQIIRLWPHALCHTNMLFGGSAKGYQLLSDSNYDWGQGLPDLVDWHQSHKERPILVWYFGTDPNVTQFRQLDPQTILSPSDLMKQIQGSWLAVSTTQLMSDGSQTWIARYLKQLTPIDRTRTFLIYDFGQHKDDSRETRQ
jgi:hypothetical protein